MRVMIVNPRFHLPIDTRTSPHLGLAYLAAVSEQRGDDVLVYDADVEDDPITEVINRFDPQIVGITANTPQVKSAWRTAQAVKSIKDVPVVLGGPHVSVLPAESAVKPQVDVVVRGEGEAVWIKLCEIIEQAGQQTSHFTARDLLNSEAGLLDGLLGISYVTTDGRERHNPDHPPIADLDTLPFPAYHFLKLVPTPNLKPPTIP
ncbi:MAG: cobalamin-dependent protein [Anaerolineae bacterium]|nr:cobalamin-dependent protein [Anaerolineae bacterium]